MKTSLIATLIISILCSCKKDEISGYKNKLSGKWEYVRYEGYPFNSIPLPPGNGNILVLTKEGSFERRSYDSISFKGLYNLEEKKDCYGEDLKMFIITNDSLFYQESIIETTLDTLFIRSPNCLADGGVSIYRRM